MLITPYLIADEHLKLDESIPAGTIDYAPDIQQVGPLKVTGRAELIIEHRGPRETVEDIRIRGQYEGDFEMPCARCLDPVKQHLTGEFDLIFRPAGADAEGGEHSITEDETEIGYYEESGLLLEDAVREQVVLTLPGRALCQPDCQGLCPLCGANRNSATCDCSEKPADPRWNALAGIAAGMTARPKA